MWNTDTREYTREIWNFIRPDLENITINEMCLLNVHSNRFVCKKINLSY